MRSVHEYLDQLNKSRMETLADIKAEAGSEDAAVLAEELVRNTKFNPPRIDWDSAKVRSSNEPVYGEGPGLSGRVIGTDEVYSIHVPYQGDHDYLALHTSARKDLRGITTSFNGTGGGGTMVIVIRGQSLKGADARKQYDEQVIVIKAFLEAVASDAQSWAVRTKRDLSQRIEKQRESTRRKKQKISEFGLPEG